MYDHTFHEWEPQLQKDSTDEGEEFNIYSLNCTITREPYFQGYGGATISTMPPRIMQASLGP